MADDLTTVAQIESVLAATASYDVDNDVAMAKRRVAALRRKLDFPAESFGAGRDQVGQKFFLEGIERQLQQAIAFVQAVTPPSEAQRLANPSVVHADFSTFRGYGPGYPPGPDRDIS